MRQGLLGLIRVSLEGVVSRWRDMLIIGWAGKPTQLR